MLPTTSSRIKGFGDDNYSRAGEFHRSKSPAKMSLMYNESFKTLQLGDRNEIAEANSVKVAFPFNKNFVNTGKTDHMSKSREVKFLRDDNTPYTIKGKVILGLKSQL